ncbi:MAG: site-specific integrase [Acidobacteriota bacterium]|nr:site-specific integrase [Acidobacteriota bacterium]
MAYALYDGESPIIPATVYLRHLGENAGLDPNTILSAAYALKTFFEFLRENETSFWELTPRFIKQFKRFHLTRKDADGRPSIRKKTARLYLTAVKGLVHYWRGLQDDDPFFADAVAELDGRRERKSRRGMLLHSSWNARVPSSTWRVRIPTAEAHDKQRYKGLPRESCLRVMEVLEGGPRGSELETMFYYRDRAVWTFLLMTGLRKGELVRVRWEDVEPHTGVVYLKDRPEDAWLGDLKTGPGEVFVTTTNPYWDFLDEWIMRGRWITESMLKARGEEDHGLLFCNRDGGPLTQAAVDHLFKRLKTACGFGPEVFFSPHITRHTIACVMLNNGVELTEVQRFLRHRSVTSTEIYAEVSTVNLRRAMEGFWARYEVTG